MTENERLNYQIKLSDIFRPGAPVDSKQLFSGRKNQVEDVINATFQPGQHVVMFGERGVGKTSLARTLVDILRAAGITPLSSCTINCDGTDDFSKLWHKVFRELQVVVRTEKAGFAQNIQEESINLDRLLPRKVSPDDVRVAIAQAINVAADEKRMIIILDEVDRINNQVTTLLSDTIKNLSDHLVPVTMILVGVADAVDQLISQHKSIERSLVQVPIPRMSREELSEIVQKGFSYANMTIEDRACNQIISLSSGLPHFTHLLGLESGNCAINSSRTNVLGTDVVTATTTAVKKSHSLLSAYHKATDSPQKSIFEQVLLACAMAKKDDLGWFSASKVVEPLSDLMEKEYSLPYFSRHLNEFSSAKRGPILQKYGTHRQHRYRFVNPLMEPFAIIRAISRGTLKIGISNVG